jgi:hypothetical protein
MYTLSTHKTSENVQAIFGSTIFMKGKNIALSRKNGNIHVIGSV